MNFTKNKVVALKCVEKSLKSSCSKLQITSFLSSLKLSVYLKEKFHTLTIALEWKSNFAFLEGILCSYMTQFFFHSHLQWEWKTHIDMYKKSCEIIYDFISIPCILNFSVPRMRITWDYFLHAAFQTHGNGFRKFLFFTSSSPSSRNPSHFWYLIVVICHRCCCCLKLPIFSFTKYINCARVKNETKLRILGVLNEIILKEFTQRQLERKFCLQFTHKDMFFPYLYSFVLFISPYGTKSIFVFFFSCEYFALKRNAMRKLLARKKREIWKYVLRVFHSFIGTQKSIRGCLKGGFKNLSCKCRGILILYFK